MGTFCAIIPVGTAAGYCYASLFAGATGNWGTAFILEVSMSPRDINKRIKK